ncbi:MAG: hypothetical protein J4G13_12650 [Dehalococcoidia bacterium]|nr:hypothetical protein [Dehalococcoidia bacterium]
MINFCEYGFAILRRDSGMGKREQPSGQAPVSGVERAGALEKLSHSAGRN